MQTRHWLVMGVAMAVVTAGCGGSTAETTTVATSEVTTTTQAATTTTTEATTTTAAETTTTTAVTTTAGPTTTTEPASALTGLLITQVVFGEHVTITNHTDDDVSLDGMWLCNRPEYLALSGSLAPGESVEIGAGSLQGLSADGGEVGLYNARSFGDSGAMTDYVAWGSGGGRTSVAEGAGLWGSGDSAPNDGTGVLRTESAGGSDSWAGQ